MVNKFDSRATLINCFNGDSHNQPIANGLIIRTDKAIGSDISEIEQIALFNCAIRYDIVP